MTTNDNAGPHRDQTCELLGAYLLGGLSDADRSVMDRHLADCDPCLDEATSHAPAIDLLHRHRAAAPRYTGRLDEPPTEPPLAPKRRRGTVPLAVAAALLTLAAGVGLGTLITDLNTEESMSIALNPMPGATMRGDATFTKTPWGTAVSLSVRDMPANGPFSLRANGVRGRIEHAATWGPTTEATQVTGAISMPIDMVDSITVLDAQENPIATARIPG